jgi:DNA (cytosine-5)-methyltransferase 1
VTIGSLFSGIGGLERGLESCGLGPVLWQAEKNPHARSVLAKRFPGVHCYSDVAEVDEHAARPTVLCAGFPCTDISQAAHRDTASATVPGSQSGLWREVARAVRLVRPAITFVENVEALRGRGMGEVLGDLAEVGHDAEWDCFRACEAGAPHARPRMYLLSHADGSGQSALSEHAEMAGVRPAPGDFWDGRTPPAGAVGMADGIPGELDRLAACGNAAVPQQAALAWSELSVRAAKAVRG